MDTDLDLAIAMDTYMDTATDTDQYPFHLDYDNPHPRTPDLQITHHQLWSPLCLDPCLSGRPPAPAFDQVMSTPPLSHMDMDPLPTGTTHTTPTTISAAHQLPPLQCYIFKPKPSTDNPSHPSRHQHPYPQLLPIPVPPVQRGINAPDSLYHVIPAEAGN